MLPCLLDFNWFLAAKGRLGLKQKGISRSLKILFKASSWQERLLTSPCSRTFEEIAGGFASRTLKLEQN